MYFQNSNLKKIGLQITSEEVRDCLDVQNPPCDAYRPTYSR